MDFSLMQWKLGRGQNAIGVQLKRRIVRKFIMGGIKDFADYGNPEEWKEKFNDHEAFKKRKEEESEEVEKIVEAL